MGNLGDAIEERGEKKKLIEMVCKKMKKEKSLAVIVEELEEEESVMKGKKCKLSSLRSKNSFNKNLRDKRRNSQL